MNWQGLNSEETSHQHEWRYSKRGEWRHRRWDQKCSSFPETRDCYLQESVLCRQEPQLQYVKMDIFKLYLILVVLKYLLTIVLASYTSIFDVKTVVPTNASEQTTFITTALQASQTNKTTTLAKVSFIKCSGTWNHYITYLIHSLRVLISYSFK